MWIEFLRPKQGYGYFKGQRANIDEKLAEILIDKGYAKNASPPHTSDLPFDLPGRTALLNEGLTTKAQVLAAKDVLTDIKGIGEKTASEIVSFLEKQS